MLVTLRIFNLPSSCDLITGIKDDLLASRNCVGIDKSVGVDMIWHESALRDNLGLKVRQTTLFRQEYNGSVVTPTH